MPTGPNIGVGVLGIILYVAMALGSFYTVYRYGVGRMVAWVYVPAALLVFNIPAKKVIPGLPFISTSTAIGYGTIVALFFRPDQLKKIRWNIIDTAMVLMMFTVFNSTLAVEGIYEAYHDVADYAFRLVRAVPLCPHCATGRRRPAADSEIAVCVCDRDCLSCCVRGALEPERNAARPDPFRPDTHSVGSGAVPLGACPGDGDDGPADRPRQRRRAGGLHDSGAHPGQRQTLARPAAARGNHRSGRDGIRLDQYYRLGRTVRRVRAVLLVFTARFRMGAGRPGARLPGDRAATLHLLRAQHAASGRKTGRLGRRVAVDSPEDHSRQLGHLRLVRLFRLRREARYQQHRRRQHR